MTTLPRTAMAFLPSARRRTRAADGLAAPASPQRGKSRRLALRPDEVADLGIGLGLPAAAVEDAVMADLRLQVVRLLGSARGRCTESCAATVWPTAQISSRSPSTVISAVRSIAPGSTGSPRTRKRPCGRSWRWNTRSHRLQIEIGRQIHDRAVLVVEGAGRRGAVAVAARRDGGTSTNAP